MPREFDGTSTYTLTGTPGSLVGMDAGPITLAAVVKLNSTATDGALIYCGGGAESGVDLELFGGSYYMGSNDPALATASTADGWHLVAATKASGTQAPRFHKYVFSSTTWTHSDAGSTQTDGVAVGSGDTLQMGRWGTASMRINGAIQIAAVWDRVLTDAEIELLVSSVQAWYAAAPKEGWLLDQFDTTTSIVSWTGGGANFTAGAALVSTDSGPGLSYGFNVETPTSVTAAAGTTANAGNASGTGTANNPSTAVSANAGVASATGAANSAAASPAASAGAAVGAATANSPSLTLAVAAGAGAATGAANGTAASLGATPSTASATAAALTPSAKLAVNAGNATGTGVANNPSVTTSSGTSAFAGLATATAVANTAGTSVLVGAGVAAASGAATNASTGGTVVPGHLIPSAPIAAHSATAPHGALSASAPTNQLNATGGNGA